MEAEPTENHNNGRWLRDISHRRVQTFMTADRYLVAFNGPIEPKSGCSEQLVATLFVMRDHATRRHSNTRVTWPFQAIGIFT